MKKKGGLLKVFIFLLLILAIVAGAAYYLYAKTDMFLSPSQKFQKYLIKNVEAIESFNNEPYTTFYNKAKGKTIEEVETTKYKIDFSEVSEELEGFSIEPEIVLTTKSDLENNNFDLNVKVNTNFNEDKLKELIDVLAEEDVEDIEDLGDLTGMDFGMPFIDLDFLVSSDSIALYYPELYDKQFVVENAGIKNFVANMAGDEEVAELIPDKIHILEDIQTEETQKRIADLGKAYYMKLIAKFPDSAFTEEKNVTTVIDGNEYKTNKYTFTISNADLGKAVFELYDEILQDEELRDILSHDFDGLLDKVYESYKEVTWEDIAPEEDAKKDIVFNIYEYKQNTIKNEIVYDESTVSLSVVNDKNHSKLLATVDTVTHPSYNSELGVGMKTVFTMDNKYENQIGTNTMTLTTEYNQDDLDKLIDDSVNGEDSWNSSYYDEDYYRERYKYMTEKPTYTVTTESVLSDDNVITTTVKAEDLFKELEEEEEEFKVEVVENGMTMRAADDIEMIKVDKENGVKILEIEDPEEFTKIGMEILENLEKGKNNATFAQAIYRIANSFSGGVSPLNNTSGEDTDIDIETPTPTLPTDPVEDDTEEDDDEDALISLTPSSSTTDTDADHSEDVNADISFALTKCLSQYRAAAAMDSSTSPNDYLTVENIQNNSSLDMTISLIDGQTLECDYQGSTYTVEINIDGSAWQLLSVTTTKN